MGTKCPIDGCDAEPSNINNHVHASSGDGHGDRYSYPDGFNKDSHTTTEPGSEASQQQADDAGQQAAADDDGSGNVARHDPIEKSERAQYEANEFAAPGAEAITLDDDIDDRRTYHCGECGSQVGYLANTCDNCGEGLVWGGVDPDRELDDDGDDPDDGETAEMDTDVEGSTDG